MAGAFAPETLLDTPAAAKRLKVSESFLAKARMKGTGPRSTASLASWSGTHPPILIDMNSSIAGSRLPKSRL